MDTIDVMANPTGPTRNPKQALFEPLAVIARALGSGARLELLDFLAQGSAASRTWRR
jgi:hypothetical protein